MTAEPAGSGALPSVMKWVGIVTAFIGLFGSLAGGITWLISHHRQQAERQGKMAVAEAQVKQGEYQAAMQSYAEILKAEPLYRPALDKQLNAAMLWAENFHILTREGQNAGDLAAPGIDQILATLDAGLTRTRGAQAADVQAHIGWTHWLNQHIAEREFGPAAEQNFRAALTTDPNNAYAHAMLGNWMLQNHGNFSEAIHHLQPAVSTGKARPFVRQLQVGGLIYLDQPGARAEQVRVADEMRKSGEAMEDGEKSRILSFCFSPIVTSHEELTESLSAVPPDDAWKTYLWLAEYPGERADERTPPLVRDFVEANLLEVSGKREESLAKFRALQRALVNQGGSLQRSVDAAVARLSPGR